MRILRYSCFVCFLFLGLYSHGQTTFEYTYDASGNRKVRKVVPIGTPVLRKSIDTTLDKVNALITTKIYPNPVTQTLNVDLQNLPDTVVAYLELWDLRGSKISRQDKLQVTNQVDFSSLPTAAYILVIMVDKKRFEYKVLKQ